MHPILAHLQTCSRFKRGMASLTLVLASLPVIAAPQTAGLFEPFTTSSMNPFTRLHGLPSTRSAMLTPRKAIDAHVQIELANNFTQNTNGTEAIVIDGESLRSNIVLGYGLSDRWEIGIEIPYIRHAGGHLDNFIERWHNLFGLPGGGRKDVPQDLLQYQYANGSGAAVNLTSQSSGVGDITLTAGFLLKQGDSIRDARITLRGGVKLPTGNATRLLGSDGRDVHLGVYYSQPSFLGIDSLFGHANVGVINLGNNKIFHQEVNDWAAYGSGTVVWQASTRMSLKAQFDFHSAIYDSGLRQLGQTSGLLSLGGSLMITPKMRLDISVGEDILTDTTPDVVLQFGIHQNF